MNALIISAILGVIMMFSGILLKQKSGVRGIAIGGLVLVLLSNVLEMNGTHFFKVKLHGMIEFDHFSFLFVSGIIV